MQILSSASTNTSENKSHGNIKFCKDLLILSLANTTVLLKETRLAGIVLVVGIPILFVLGFAER